MFQEKGRSREINRKLCPSNSGAKLNAWKTRSRPSQTFDLSDIALHFFFNRANYSFNCITVKAGAAASWCRCRGTLIRTLFNFSFLCWNSSNSDRCTPPGLFTRKSRSFVEIYLTNRRYFVQDIDENGHLHLGEAVFERVEAHCTICFRCRSWRRLYSWTLNWFSWVATVWPKQIDEPILLYTNSEGWLKPLCAFMSRTTDCSSSAKEQSRLLSCALSGVGSQNWLTCLHKGKMPQVKTKVRILNMLMCTVRTHKGSRVEVSSAFREGRKHRDFSSTWTGLPRSHGFSRHLFNVWALFWSVTAHGQQNKRAFYQLDYRTGSNWWQQRTWHSKSIVPSLRRCSSERQSTPECSRKHCSRLETNFRLPSVPSSYPRADGWIAQWLAISGQLQVKSFRVPLPWCAVVRNMGKRLCV